MVVLLVLMASIFVSYNLELGLYLYFKNFDQGLKLIYLKKFFNNVTNIGDSFFYFVFCLSGFLLVLFFRKSEGMFFKKIYKLKNLFIYLIICLLFSGVLAQILKHIIGRARPNHSPLENLFSFDFFTFSSAFHSFPSGHATTIFVLAFVFSSIVPKLKYVFFTFALIVAFSMSTFSLVP